MHLAIAINARTVRQVAVHNEGPCSDGVHHRYRWEVPGETGFRGQPLVGHVLHRSEDGATALAVKVLDRVKLQPIRPVEKSR